MPSEQEMEQEYSDAALSSDPLIVEYSTTNIIIQAVNMAELTFAVSGSAYASERLPAQSPMESGGLPTQEPMGSGY